MKGFFKIILYYLFCDMLTLFPLAPIGGASVRGRYSHIAAVMEGRVLLVAGGYSGVARGDLLAYKVPLFVSSDPGDRVKTLDYTFSRLCFSVSVCVHLH